MNDFLPSATDFTDMTVRNMPSEYFPGMEHYTVLCPVCKGHGGWNLQLNAYRGDTPEQRNFRAMCGQCWGWGWVEPGLDATCIHTPIEVKPDQPYRCWHTTECTKCGRRRSYDSSD